MSSVATLKKARSAKRAAANKVIHFGGNAQCAVVRRKVAAVKKHRRVVISEDSAQTFGAISDPKNAELFTVKAALAAFKRITG